MSIRVVDRVEEWGERSFTGGYSALSQYEDQEFSGVVRAGDAELYMTKGVIIGIQNGAIEDFEDMSGTAYEAPSPALPLLAIMQETNDEVRGEYYSEKTSIAEVDSTLSNGGFTGYIELSENILSGDYYQVYHAGKSMSVGFVGESERLIQGDEAFETADGEVGIYQVRPADITAIDIPEQGRGTPTGSDDSGTGGVSGVGQTDGTDTVESQEEERRASSATASERETENPTTTGEQQTNTTTEAAGESRRSVSADPTPEIDQDHGDEQAETTTRERTDTRTQSEPQETQPEPQQSTQHQGQTDTRPQDQPQTESGEQRQPESRQERTQQPQDQSSQRQPTQERTEPHTDRPAQDTSRQPVDDQSDRRRETDQRQPTGSPEPDLGDGQYSRQDSPSQSGEEIDMGLETRAIPSLDPGQTVEPGGELPSVGGQASESHRASEASPETSRNTQEPQTQTAADTVSETTPSRTQPSDPEPTQQAQPARTQSGDKSRRVQSEPDAGVQSEKRDELEAELEEREAEIDRLESELTRKTTEHEDTKDQLETVRQERDELRAEVERLETELKEMETELERLETEFGATTGAERRMTPEEALTKTDLLPRYDSKSDATLKKAHASNARADEVEENLELLTKPQFEDESVSVAGQRYDEYLEATLEYRFTEWIVRDLLFEIRETGHQKGLKDLYNAIPQMNRIDLNGVVEAIYSEDGQENRTEKSFDIVFRDRMGEPLLVANLNDSREGATEEMMEELVRDAKRVGQSTDEFAGAFLVSRGVFESAALDIAEEATKGGLFSRDKRTSFVNLSRKQGYHLCLVEATSESFSLLVPEL